MPPLLPSLSLKHSRDRAARWARPSAANRLKHSQGSAFRKRSGSKMSGASDFIHSARRVSTRNQTDSRRDAKAEDASWDRKHIWLVSKPNLFFLSLSSNHCASAQKEEEDRRDGGGGNVCQQIRLLNRSKHDTRSRLLNMRWIIRFPITLEWLQCLSWGQSTFS